MITIRKELHRTSRRARRCSTNASATPASRRRPSGCARAACRRTGLAFVASDRGRVVGTARLWNVSAGPSRPALLLGPLAVHPDYRCRGLGGALMRALAATTPSGSAIAPSCWSATRPTTSASASRPRRPAACGCPDRYDANRFLALELAPGALAGARGLVSPTGRLAPKPALSTLVARANPQPIRARGLTPLAWE